MAQPDLFDLYFEYRKDTEPPAIFHRWALTACIGAWLGRQCWIPFGDKRIFPNHFIMFVGDPGSRKSTAIKQAVSIIRSINYANFGAQRTSKEKFLLDLAGESDDSDAKTKKSGARYKLDIDEIDVIAVHDNIPKEVFIDADEFNDFMGPGNIEFQSILGSLWDWDETEVGWVYRLKNSKSLDIFQPTISILAGNTPSNFALCFPPASVGQGFMSRLLLIYGQSTGRKITFPTVPPEQLKERLQRQLLEMKRQLHGAISISSRAQTMLDILYKSWPDLDDLRFRHYSTRRLTHLLKLCIIYCSARLGKNIEEEDVTHANTALSFAETLMPKAMGEAGKGKYSEGVAKIMQHLFNTRSPQTKEELWKIVHRDVDRATDLDQILNNLERADLIHYIAGAQIDKPGYLPRNRNIDRKVMYVDKDYLKGHEIS